MPLKAVLTRVFVPEMEPAIAFYRQLTGEPVSTRFRYGPLELVSIGQFLLLAGPEEALAPFRNRTATLQVDRLDPYLDAVVAAGGSVLAAPKEVPTGRNMILKHPDGAIFEYVELRQ